MYRIGCDVGGTNTDAVLLDSTLMHSATRGVLSKHKTPTTSNVTEGITTAIQHVLDNSAIDHSQVSHVAIGTTHFVNAVVERDMRRLQRVAVVRLCGPYTRSVPPFSDFPYALRDVIEGPVFYLDGGLDIDGREIVALDEQQVRKTADEIVAAGLSAVAVVGIFSALDHEGKHEERCKQIMLSIHPHLQIVPSHSIGGPGLLVRENATILNAAILSFAKKTIIAFSQAVKRLGLECPFYLTQNDGTQIDAKGASQVPIKTFASGPTNSLVGAAFLCDKASVTESSDRQVLVVDIGGTTTDICALLPSGLPRKAPSFVHIAGVKTAFSMPEVYSIGLGGGSRVRVKASGEVTVGPDSVGHLLTQEAMVFGGLTMTATDIMVAGGHAIIGDKSKVSTISKKVIDAAILEIRKMIEGAIGKMKVSADPTMVLLVGGGSIIFPESVDSAYVEPDHHDAANAIGAAISKISGSVDIIEILEGRNEDVVLANAKQQAVLRAIEAGADQQDISITEVTKIPLQYVNNKATRIMIKAIGPLKNVIRKDSGSRETDEEILRGTDLEVDESETKSFAGREGNMANPSLHIDLAKYRPDVRDHVWYISPIDVELLAIGCGILGTGGGGSPYNMSLYVLDILRKQGHGIVRVISPEHLKDSDICVLGSGYGAPSVSDERLQSGGEISASIEELNKLLGYKDFQGIVADEIGGGNGIVTFPTSARFGRPVIDCDFMGRAYPTIEHCTPYVYGHPVMPVAMADAKGNVSIVVKAENNTKLEGMLRTTCVELGNAVAVTGKPLNGKVIKECAIPNTVSQAWFLGRAVLLARRNKIDMIKAIEDVTPVKLLFTGKITDVRRDVSRGYTVGQCVIAPLSADESESRSHPQQKESRDLIITFQNEYLAAYHLAEGAKGGGKEVVCIVPDLISILGSNGEALGSPDLRYGLQVRVIAMPAHPLWTESEEAFRVGGPEFFELDLLWKPVGRYVKPKSVIEMYE